MNNYEKIKQMTVDEMAEWLDYISEECSNMCSCTYDTCRLDSDCQENIKQWLLQVVEND